MGTNREFIAQESADAFDARHLIPNKRLYPEACDFTFCLQLKRLDLYLSHTLRFVVRSRPALPLCRKDVLMPAPRKQYTHLEMEAALCVWEWINDVTLDDTPRTIKEWVTLREGVGSVELRHQSIVLGRWCLKIYDLLTKRDSDFFDSMAYDWEVIPMMLRNANDPAGVPVSTGLELSVKMGVQISLDDGDWGSGISRFRDRHWSFQAGGRGA